MKSIVMIVLLFSLCILPVSVYAQDTGIIMGKILDNRTEEPLPGVNVILKDMNLGAATDSDGSYKIINVPQGTYTLFASMVGYKRKYVYDIFVRTEEIVTQDFTLVEDILGGEEVVVTATRTPKLVKDVPIRTTLISQQKIEAKSANNLYEALNNEPGIRVEQQCSNCNFSQIRMSGLEGGYAQMLIDGQPIFTGLAGVYGLQQIQTGNIERIEVVKGSGSALYGSDALAGVINVIMKEPGLLPSFNIGANVGTHGTNHFTASGTHRRGDIGIVFSAQKDIEDGIDVGGADDAPYTDTGKDGLTDRIKSSNFGGSAKLYWFNALGGKSRLKLNANIVNEFRKGGLLAYWDDPYNPDSEHIRTERYETGIGLDKEFLTGQKINMNFNFVKHYRNASNGAAWDKAIDAGMVDDDLNYTAAGQTYVNEHGFAQFRETYYPKPFIADERLYLGDFQFSQGFGHHILLFGAQYRRSNLDQILNGDPSDKSAKDAGVYVQGDFHISEKVELITGLRYDNHHSEDDLTRTEYDESAVNPRAALRISPTQDFAIRANFGMGFRVPYLFAEDLHLCASAPRIFKGPDLASEKAVSFSLSADLYKADYRLGVNIFRTNIKDKMEFISADDEPIPAGYDYKWANLGEAYTQGLELSVGGISYNGLVDYSLDVVYTDSKFDEARFTQDDYPCDDGGWKNSDHIPRSPEWTGNISLSLNPEQWKFMVQANYIGSMYIDHVHEEDMEQFRIEETDAFVTVNGKISRKFSRKLTFFVGAKNLFNYLQPKRDVTDAAYMWAPLYGRIVYAGFNVAVQ